MKELLKIERLNTWFPIREGVFSRVSNYVKAVQNVSLKINEGEILSLVGESGCGKSTLGNSIVGLTPAQSGRIWFNQQELDITKPSAWKNIRNQVQMIFQNPNGALNPRLTIFDSMAAPMLAHKLCTKKELKDRIAHYLEKVGLSADYMNRFPHAFSGGQKQRICIARAICLEPKMIVCDEITSALDVSVQAQILHLVKELQEEMKLTLLFITHDLSVVKNISDRVAVMYLGKIVEQGAAQAVLNNPAHPYTNALMDAIPTLEIGKKPQILAGDVPSPVHLPSGCFFASRCSQVMEKCQTDYPPTSCYQQRDVACFLRTS